MLGRARDLVGAGDAAVVDAALEALLARHRSAEVDVAYAAAYDAAPLYTADAWGDLASFRRSDQAT